MARTPMSDGSQYDVAILGGGLAGLSLALHLKRQRPETSVVVLEKKKHPVPEAAHKVGESSLHLGSHYFAHTCGLHEHLERHQITKMGLRYFLADDHEDIAKRTEIGLSSWIDTIREYQIDRGRFENAMAEIAQQEYGVTFLDECAVRDVELDPEGEHRVTGRTPDGEVTVEPRWVVDASGRAAILKNKLGLREDNTHHCNAAWFRLGKEIKIDDLSDDPAWSARVRTRTRWQSTNHLFGPGYWFWLIPLASGCTSFGLVADPDLVPWEDMRRFEPLMDWLHRAEPQAAAAIEPHRETLRDFRTLKHYSHGCKQVYSKDRWCITGEAGWFLDPLYSPGSDAIAISNTLTTKFVTQSLDGHDMSANIEFSNNLYLLLSQRLVKMWDHQYPIFGNPGVAAAKLNWDYLPYLSGLALLVTTERIADVEFLGTAWPSINRISVLNSNMQKLLRYWAANDPDAASKVGYMGIREDRYMQLEDGVTNADDDPDALRATLVRNAANVEAAASEIMLRAAASMDVEVDPERFNPYTFALDDPYGNEATEQDRLEPVRPPDADSGIVWATEDAPDVAVHSARSTWRRPDPVDGRAPMRSLVEEAA